MLKFDDLLHHLGEFGPYQKRVYFLLCLFCVTHGMRMVIMVFILHSPSHRCAVPDLPNDTYAVTSQNHELTINMSIPVADSCHIYQLVNLTDGAGNQASNTSKEACGSWVYDQSTFISTVTSQFDLVCDDNTRKSLATMTFYGGYLIGVFTLGAISDLIGRKMCLYLSLTLLIIFGISLAFTNSFIVFAVVNFFVGASTTGIFSSALVIGIELVGPSKRTFTGMFTHVFFSLGVISLAGLAYLVREWRHLQIAITAPLVLFYFTWCFIPESPRWQIQKGQYAKARLTVKKLEAVNKRRVPDCVLDSVVPATKGEPDKAALSPESPDSKSVKHQSDGLVGLLTSRVLFLRTCILFLNWTVVSMTFYGLNFNTGNLGGSIYLNMCLAGLVEIPAHFTTIFTVDRFGRKKVHSAMMVTSGIACLLCLVSIIYTPPDLQWVTVTLAMMGKFGASGGFGTVYLYSTEIYPTVIRNSALGASSSCARIGAMLAPYIAAQGGKTDGGLGKGLPMLICGILMLLAGFLALMLPETLHRKLPETIADARNFTRSYTEAKTPVSAATEQEVLTSDRVNGHCVSDV